VSFRSFTPGPTRRSRSRPRPGVSRGRPGTNCLPGSRFHVSSLESSGLWTTSVGTRSGFRSQATGTTSHWTVERTGPVWPRSSKYDSVILDQVRRERAVVEILPKLRERDPQVFGDVATRDVDERDARVEEDPAGVDVLPEVELLGRVPVVGRPAEPDHHHVLDDFRVRGAAPTRRWSARRWRRRRAGRRPRDRGRVRRDPGGRTVDGVGRPVEVAGRPLEDAVGGSRPSRSTTRVISA